MNGRAYLPYSYFLFIEPQIVVGARQCRAPTMWHIYLKTAVSHSHIIKQWYIGQSANDAVPSEDRTLQI